MAKEQKTIFEEEADVKPIGRSTIPRKPKSNTAQKVSDVVTGDFIFDEKIKRVYPLVLYAALLVFLYVAHHFNYQRLQREEIQQRLELNKERGRAIVFSSMRMNQTRPSYIINEVNQRGLKLEESKTPPKIIEQR